MTVAERRRRLVAGMNRFYCFVDKDFCIVRLFLNVFIIKNVNTDITQNSILVIFSISLHALLRYLKQMDSARNVVKL